MVTHASRMVEVVEGDLDGEERHGHLNTLKMAAYLLCQFIDLYEAEVNKPSILSGKVSSHLLFTGGGAFYVELGEQWRAKTCVWYLIVLERRKTWCHFGATPLIGRNRNISEPFLILFCYISYADDPFIHTDPLNKHNFPCETTFPLHHCRYVKHEALWWETTSYIRPHTLGRLSGL